MTIKTDTIRQIRKVTFYMIKYLRNIRGKQNRNVKINKEYKEQN